MKHIFNLIKWIFIALFALSLLIPITILAFPVAIFKSFWKRKVGNGLDNMATYFKVIAISTDQLGNVSGFSALDFIFIKPEGYKFGDEDETISYVLKVNHQMNTLRPAGRVLYKTINGIDPGHFDKLTD